MNYNYLLKRFKAFYLQIPYGILLRILVSYNEPVSLANTITSSLETAFGFNIAVAGAILVVVLATIIFWGIKRIVNVTQIIVSFMAVGYILIACSMIIPNIKKLPDTFMLITTSAFALDSVFGGIIGLAISWG